MVDAPTIRRGEIAGRGVAGRTPEIAAFGIAWPRSWAGRLQLPLWL